MRDSLLAGRLTRCLPLPAFVLISLWGCAAALSPTPQREWVVLRVSNSTHYYSIHGTTPSAIFDDLDRHGLSDLKARRAVGLTAGEWSIDWKAVEARAVYCRVDALTITLTLAVTLPRHVQLDELSPDIRTAWERFAARVDAHEQRHVDIYRDGAKAMKTRMEAIPLTTSSCSALETTIRGVWVRQQAETERAQEAFHLEDEAKIQNDRKPLQAQIDVNQTRLATINSEIGGLDQTLADLKRRSDTTHDGIEAVKIEMGKSSASPAGCSQPRLPGRIQAFCHRHNELVASYNTLVGQYNDAIAHRNELAAEHNRIASVLNGLFEALNWTR